MYFVFTSGRSDNRTVIAPTLSSRILVLMEVLHAHSGVSASSLRIMMSTIVCKSTVTFLQSLPKMTMLF